MTSPETIEAFWPKDLFEKGIGWVLGEFEPLDIYLLDVSPRNISFRD